MNSAGIGKKVLGELGDVVKKTAEDTVKAGTDIVKGTVETVVGGTPPVTQSGERLVEQEGSSQSDPAETLKRQGMVKKQRGLQRVRAELAGYVREKQQKDTQKDRVEERQGEIKKEQEKEIKESERDAMIRQAQRSGGGTGEMSRKKY